MQRTGVVTNGLLVLLLVAGEGCSGVFGLVNVGTKARVLKERVGEMRRDLVGEMISWTGEMISLLEASLHSLPGESSVPLDGDVTLGKGETGGEGDGER